MASGQTDAWLTVNRPYFSFKYPAGWRFDQKTTGGGAIDSAVEPGQQRAIMVSFQPGFSNKPGILNQCASIDDYIEGYYQAMFLPLATGTGQYPYTTVTHDTVQPGSLGGRATRISVVHMEAYQNPVTHLTWVEAVPRVDGIYLVSYMHPSEPMAVSETFRKRVFRSVVFKSKPLAGDAYCNYLGK